VNKKFAEVVLEEMRGCSSPLLFVQDYHFALLPRLVKDVRPDARVAMFWHIPWPNSEVFGICPWQAELLDGMLGSDLIGFHLQSHCNNFLETVDRVLEARTDWEQFNIQRNGHTSSVRPYPISVAWDESTFASSGPNEKGAVTKGEMARSKVSKESFGIDMQEAFIPEDDDPGIDIEAVHRELGIEGKRLLLGVDRMDCTKGIVERMIAMESLLQKHPSYLEQIVFMQIASPSRTRIPAYVDLRLQVEETVERINRRFQTSRWKPILLVQRQCPHDELTRYYRAADLCLVTSLHDGMNLVAKEYLAARNDCDGMLVLSRFAGAAQELTDALLVNPYDAEQMSEAIHVGLEMSLGERRLRMDRMRRYVKEHNVYRWASKILTYLCAVRIEDEVLESMMNRSQRKLA